MKRSMRQLAWQWVLPGALLMGGGATSVWAQNVFPDSGNVGIGTTGPKTILHALGNVRADVSSAQSYAEGLSIATTSTSTYGLVHYHRVAVAGDAYSGSTIRWSAGMYNDENYRIIEDNANTRLFIKDGTGNVGIGTTGPKTILHALGNVRADVSSAQSYAEGLSIATTSTSTYGLVHYHRVAVAGDAYSGSTIRWSAGMYNDENYRIIEDNANTRLFIKDGTGNVGIGTTGPVAKLHVVGDMQVDGNLAAKYQDVAEWVRARNPLPQGTVVVIDPQGRNQVLPASESYDPRVAGVVSSQPGLLLGEAGEGKVKVAQSGRVKVKVDATYGPIAAGDLLVTSPTPGHAMRSTPVDIGRTLLHRPGTLLGKALEQLEGGRGEILVLLTLQ